MCIYTRITSSARQRLIVLVRDVLSSFGVSISFGQAEVDHVDNILFLAVAYQEVVRFHVPVDEVVIMEEFESLNHLVGQHERGLDRELPLAVIEKVFETWPK